MFIFLRKFMELFSWLKRKDKDDDEPIVIEDIESMTDKSVINEVNNVLSHDVRKQISSHPVNSAPKVPEVQTKVEVTQPQVAPIVEQPKAPEVAVVAPKPVEPPPKPKKRYDDGFTSCRNMY
jgi:hypothetical protein